MSTTAATKAQPAMAALFVSDVHLQESLPRTTEAFLHFLQSQAGSTKELYLLGDLFEYWAGDDDIPSPYLQKIIKALRSVTLTGVKTYWLGGNRDFLVGAAFAQSTGITLLQEPYLTTISGQRVALVHGDAQCIDDKEYMRFREQVRNPEWQKQFMAMPLAQRKAIIDNMRQQSRAAQRSKSYEIMDVNEGAIESLFESTQANILIHGHTHRPAIHRQAKGNNERVRYVLPDWDCESTPARGGWLGITPDGEFVRYAVDGTIQPAC